MKNKLRFVIPMVLFAALWASLFSPAGAHAARHMENLDRGVVAVRTGSSAVFVSWRLLGLDPAGIQFNLYRSSGGAAAVKLNGTPLSGGCNYSDTTASSSQTQAYHVRPVIGGVEQTPSGTFTLAANGPWEPCVVVPLRNLPGYLIHFVWVGDLDGDGEYDYVIDRLATTEVVTQKLEAYKRDGTLLWVVDMGPNSTNTYTIEPGSSAIDVGHWDGVTVYDLDGDGRAEVMVRTANGVVFGDGATLSEPNNNLQFVSVLNGLTGAERARAPIPQDYLADGPMAAHFGVGYLNGTTPSLVAKLKNRIGSGDFNLMMLAFDFNGSSLTQKWKWLRGAQNCPDDHQIRIVDVDQDGVDEICDGGYVLNANGTLRYTLGPSGVVHGDRWHIGKFDQNRAALQGFGIQQDNPSGLHEYYYDAGNGSLLWTFFGAVADMARGDAGDLDPRYPGFEVWSFDGVVNGPSNTQITPIGTQPWPSLRLAWDGDDLSDSYNDGKIEKWDYNTSTVLRLVTTWNYETATGSDRGAPMFYGDILGDWREEAVMTSFDYTKLVIFTTPVPTARRLYTLAHNPAYRNCMTIKGYMQSHQLDYFLGDGMSTPPQPDIAYVIPTPLPVLPSAPSGLTAAVVSASQINLGWSDNSTNETGFKIERSTDGVNFAQIIIVGAGVTSYSNTGLTASTTYYYRVRASNLAGDSAYSNTASTTTFAPPPAALVHHWRFDEASGTTAADSAGSNNGTLAAGATWTAGQINNAVALNGTSTSYVSYPAGFISTLDDFSIATWVYVNANGTWARLFDFGSGTGTYMFLSPASGGGTVRYAITTSGGTGEQQINNTAVLSVGAWHHVAVTLSGTTGILYIDGVEVGRNSAMTLKPSSLGSTTANYIGKSQYADPYLNGKVDDFRIYSGALTAAEVSTLANPPATIPNAPSNLTASSPSKKKITLNWTDNATNETGFKIERSTNGVNFTQIATVGANVTTYANTGLTSGTTYYYRVRAYNTGGDSAYSNTASATAK